MALVHLDLSPGVFKDGTKYGARGRWADSNLVRWWNGSIQTVGGWTRLRDTNGDIIAPLIADPSDEAPRNAIAWRDNDGVARFVVGTNRGLYSIATDGTVTDITPAGFTGATRGAEVINGYGVARYGQQTYGTPRTGDHLTETPAASWSFALWGENLVAQFRSSGHPYVWKPGAAQAVEEEDIPPGFSAISVTDERIMIGLCGVNLRAVRWSDSEDYTTWTASDTNQAGSQVLSIDGCLVEIKRLFDQYVIIGTSDVFVARYLGPPFVFGFTAVASDTDILGPNTVVATDNFVVWMGRRNAWVYDGNRVDAVPSAVQEAFFKHARASALSKTTGFHIRTFQEVWWLYQSVEAPVNAEADSYICYHYGKNYWTMGKINRSVGIDAAALPEVVMIAPDGALNMHELADHSFPDTNNRPFCETAPIEIGQGDRVAYIDYLYPDNEADGPLTITLKAKDMPQKPERTYGPYPLASPTMLRAQGRQIAARFDSVDGRQWKIGSMRLNFKQGGKRG